MPSGIDAHTGTQRFLIPYENPLLERVGEAFFKNLPRTPGVYRFLDAAGRILYIGHSANLRRRLADYKNARPPHAARKILRLVQRAQAITYETCASPTEARLREAALLRLHRPPFNRQNTHPESHGFVVLRCQGGAFYLSFTRHPDDLDNPRDHGNRLAPTQSFGAFSGYSTRRCLIALARLWWLQQSATSATATSAHLPCGLAGERLPGPWPLAVSKKQRQTWRRTFQRFFTGDSPRLAHRLAGQGGEALAPVREPCLRTLLNQDAEALLQFYRTGPARLRQLRANTGERQRRPVSQIALDDFLALREIQNRQLPI
ncbi:MAG: GIY-YIG nuclease family protein [Opitutales bacterium]